ncbi:MAG: OmpA family protein [Gammaproteobacteria bacterium]
MKNYLKVAGTLACVAALSGCANSGGLSKPLCMLAGAAVGGGIGIAAANNDEGIAAAGGAAVGALIGALACPEAEAAPAPEPVAEAPAPTPPPPPPADSDHDGVTDDLDKCPDTPAGQKVDASGCPEILVTLHGVNFDFNKATIKSDSASILDEAVNALNKAHDVNVDVVGHTDSVGSESYNQKLSERRASAVVDYLVAHGIAASRLSASGRGESEPVASNSTKEGRYQNRRVELRTAGYTSGGAASSSAPAGAPCNPRLWTCVWHEVQMK